MQYFSAMQQSFSVWQVLTALCRDTALQVQVCKSWKTSVEQGLCKLQSDSAWNCQQLAKVQQTFSRLQSLDLQQCSHWAAFPAALMYIQCLQHLRLCKVTGIPQADWKATLPKLKQLKTLALPWCASLSLLDAFCSSARQGSLNMHSHLACIAAAKVMLLLTLINDCRCNTLERVNLTGYKHLQRLDLTTWSQLAHITAPSTLSSLTCLNLRECSNIKNWNVSHTRTSSFILRDKKVRGHEP